MNEITPVHVVYESPTIVFEGKITTRAGSTDQARDDDLGADVFGSE